MYYQIYDAIYTSIAKVILAMVYLLFILICGIMIKAMFILLGYTFAQNIFESVIFRKCYISIAAAGAMWLTYNKEYVVDHLFVVISTACYYAYWVIAPLGLIFILSYLYSSFLFLELTHINYGIVLAICFISMLCNMRMHATEYLQSARLASSLQSAGQVIKSTPSFLLIHSTSRGRCMGTKLCHFFPIYIIYDPQSIKAVGYSSRSSS